MDEHAARFGQRPHLVQKAVHTRTHKLETNPRGTLTTLLGVRRTDQLAFVVREQRQIAGARDMARIEFCRRADVDHGCREGQPNEFIDDERVFASAAQCGLSLRSEGRP